MKRKLVLISIACFGFILLIMGVMHHAKPPIPKPRGFYRIDFPQKVYRPVEVNCPFGFELPVYVTMEESPLRPESCWWNVHFPTCGGTLYLTYLPVDHNLDRYVSDLQKAVFQKNAIQADGVSMTVYRDTSRRVSGVLYDVAGDVATAVQFYATDSAQHFLRGALYFSTTPQRDSLQPIIQFCRTDVIHLMETLYWK